MKNLCAVLIIILLPVYCFCQDMIVKTNGSKIYCRILNVDSNEITYKHPSNKEPIKIRRTEVKVYHLSSSARAQPVPANTGNQEILLISLFAGQCIPLSTFASKDLEDERSGLAEDGWSYEGSMLLKVSPFFGFIFTYKSQSYRFDDQLICDALTVNYKGATFDCDSDPWKMRGLFPGIFITFPFKAFPKLFMDIEVSGGIPKYSYPTLVSRGNPFGPFVTVTSSAPPVRAVSACMGLGFSYRLARAFAVNVHGDYLIGNPNFGSVTTRSSTGYVEISSYKQKVQALNLRVGFSLIFAKKDNAKK